MKSRTIFLSIVLFCLICEVNAADKFWQLAWFKYQLEKGTNQGDLRKFDWDAPVRLELTLKIE